MIYSQQTAASTINGLIIAQRNLKRTHIHQQAPWPRSDRSCLCGSHGCTLRWKRLRKIQTVHSGCHLGTGRSLWCKHRSCCQVWAGRGGDSRRCWCCRRWWSLLNLKEGDWVRNVGSFNERQTKSRGCTYCLWRAL